MAKVLGRCRLSHGTDESTSIERQKETIQAWADKNGHTIVDWAIDIDVSGTVDTLSQKNLAPWMQPPKIHEWDIMVAVWQSRITRGGFMPLMKLIEHVKGYGKDVQLTDGTLEIGTMPGQMIALVRAFIDKAYVDDIKEKAAESREKLRSMGRWPGGPVPYGYMKVKNDGAKSGFGLVPDPKTSVVVTDMVNRVLRYESAASIADYMNTHNIKPPRKGTKKWYAGNIARIIRRPSTIGLYEHEGDVVRGEDGLPFQMWPPLVDPSIQQQACLALDNRSRPKKFTNGKALLFGVVWCAKCQRKMYLRVSRKNRKAGGQHVYRHWRCSDPKCPTSGINEINLDKQFGKMFLDRLNKVYRSVTEFVPANDRSQQLDKVKASLERLRWESDEGLVEDEDQWRQRVSHLTALKRDLETQTIIPAHTVTRIIEPRETWAQAWERMDEDERRTMLGEAGVRVYVLDTIVTEVVTPGAWLRDVQA